MKIWMPIAAVSIAVSGLVIQPAKAYGNAYDVTERLCQMMSNGIPANQAWGYVVESGLRSEPSFYGSVGSILASGFSHGLRMRGMRREVAQLSQSMCPEYAISFSSSSSQDTPDLDEFDNTTNPSSYIPK